MGVGKDGTGGCDGCASDLACDMNVIMLLVHVAIGVLLLGQKT